MLAQWLPADCIEEVSVEAVAHAFGALEVSDAEGQICALDPSALENIRAVDGDGSVLAEVIEIYLEEAPEQLRSLRNALEGGRLGDLGRTAHALKSASLNVGARALCDLCNRLERQAKAGESAGTAELVAGIAAVTDRVCNALRAERDNLPPRSDERADSGLTTPSSTHSLNGEPA
jgi:HPt (histidine-containing phosphotransfer) domain-containing protein